MGPVSDDTIHLYNGFTLDLARGCLTHAGEPVHLRPQSYEVLRYLVEHRGRLISKDKIIEDVWQGRAVTDGSLGKCIEEVREALSVDARQFVRNVRGRGYIFDPVMNEGENGSSFSVRPEEIDVVAVVVEDEEDDGAILRADSNQNGNEAREGRNQPQNLPVGLSGLERHLDLGGTLNRTATRTNIRSWSNVEYLAKEFKRHKRTALLVLAALAIPAAALIYSGYFSSRTQPINSIAVLPFANASADPNTEYLSDGIGESIIIRLSQLPGLRVMSRNSVARYKGREMDARSAGRDLGVQAVLTGRVVQLGDELSISVELADAGDNTHIWGERYNRKLTDVVSLQTEIAHDVSRKLRARLSGADEQKLAKNYTSNVEAYQLSQSSLSLFQTNRT
ncbi:hypothetical protein BH18ACI4_BH18ACI4_28260 [soil metagenome]